MSTDNWWKLLLSGLCIIAGILVAARLEVDAWELMMVSLLVAFVTTATGMLLGVARLAQRHSKAIPT